MEVIRMEAMATAMEVTAATRVTVKVTEATVDSTTDN